MNVPLLCIGVALITICQANKEVFEGVEDNIRETIAKINRRGSLVKDNLRSDLQAYLGVIKTLTEDKVTRLDTLFDTAIQDVDRLPQVCKGDAVLALKSLHKSTVTDFLHCPALIPGLLNLVDIFNVTVEMVFDLVVTTGVAVKKLFTCLTGFWPWRILSCWFDDVVDNVDQIFDQAELYRSVVGDYFHNFTATMETCWHDSSAVVDIISVVTPAYQCANQNVPIHLYKL